MKKKLSDIVNNPGRREFLKKMWKLLGLVIIVEMLFLIGSFFRSSKKTVKFDKEGTLKVLGNVNDFEKGSVTPYRIDKLFLIRLNDGGFLAVSLTCSHLGCSVFWDKELRKFICPCHSSSFDEVGDVLESPAPRALDYYPVTIEGGRVFFDPAHKIKRKHFQKSQLTYAS